MVVTHAGPFAFAPLAPVDYAIRVALVAFHVPVFLLVSGYVHASAAPLTLSHCWRRLRRVLGPYVVASLVVTALGLTEYATWRALPENLALGGAVPIYYYVFVWSVCVVSGLAWSRLGPTALLVALAAVLLASEWRVQHPTYRFFWAVRDPLLQGWAVCYLGGWCARRFGWLDAATRYPAASAALAVAGGAPWLTRAETTIATDLRVLYSVSVAALIVACARPAPASIRWLSRETLWIYLVHLPVLERALVLTATWRPVPRIVVAASLTLAICALGITTGRAVQRAVH